MAIYRLEVKIVSRNGGRGAVGSAAYRTGKCATAAVAYRHGITLTDERTGITFDYARKSGILAAEIIAPANVPGWVMDRERLWNEVERSETRCNSRLAREIILSLPHELTAEERYALVRGYVRAHFVNDGMIADVAFHAPHRKGNGKNFHAHVMLTTREIGEGGFGQKRRDWNTITKLEQWRKGWADHLNAALERAGLPDRVDHRSLEAQGIDREPQTKLGPIASKMEREGRPSHAGEALRAIALRNAQRQALKAEHAAVTAEIIDLQQERVRRGVTDMTEEEIRRQGVRLAEEVKAAETNDPVARAEREFKAFRERALQDAAEAEKRRAAERKAPGTRSVEDGIADARERYLQSLGDFDARNPYASLIRAAITEAAIAARQHAEWRRKEAAELAKPAHERDEHKIYVYRTSRAIEVHEYYARTDEQLSRVSRLNGGVGAEQRARDKGEVSEATRYAEKAKAHQERAVALREEMAKREQERDRQEQNRMADTLGILAGSIGKGGDAKGGFDIKTYRASEHVATADRSSQQGQGRASGASRGRSGGASR